LTAEEERDRAAALPVCVLIPAYNGATEVAAAVRSALTQVPPPSEIVVVDDGSADATSAVARDAGARVIRLERNGGVSHARNAGIRATQQEWIALLDCDDEWLPGHLAALWELRNSHKLVAGSALERPREGGMARLYGSVLPSPEALTPTNVIVENRVPVSSTMFSRADAIRVGLFDTGLPRGEDLDFWIRLLETGTGILSPEVMTLYWRHPGQVSHDMAKIHADHLAIAHRYSDREWWTSRSVERFEVASTWGAAQRRRLSGDRRGALIEGSWILKRPRRVGDLMRLWWRRLALRRGGARFDYRGGPSLALLPGTSPDALSGHDSSGWRDLRDAHLFAALWSLVRRPTALAVVAKPTQARVLRAIGIRVISALGGAEEARARRSFRSP
jgi:glycosyltransferase involved in cell wall biosynthesis